MAERFAAIRDVLRRRGGRIADVALLVAVTALEHDPTRLTVNRKDVRRIPDPRLYQPSEHRRRA